MEILRQNTRSFPLFTPKKSIVPPSPDEEDLRSFQTQAVINQQGSRSWIAAPPVELRINDIPTWQDRPIDILSMVKLPNVISELTSGTMVFDLAIFPRDG